MKPLICTCETADRPTCGPLLLDPIDPTRSMAVAAGFGALGDPHRVAIVHLLAMTESAVCVADIERHIDLAQSTVSYHLKALVDAGLVTFERHGKWSYYSVVPERLKDLALELDGFAGDARGEVHSERKAG